MTRIFETEKHFKKRHFIKHPLNSAEKTTAFKGKIESSNREKEVAKKPTQTLPAAPSVNQVAVMAERRESTVENRNWRDTFIKKWHTCTDQFPHFFKRLCSYF
jgi:hypothetical protein